MFIDFARIPRRWMTTLAVVAAAATCVVQQAGSAGAAPGAITLPPLHGGFDYQITQPYDVPPGVTIVSRDHTADPAPNIYNICYVNGFQIQVGAEGQWDDDLILRDKDGNIVRDPVWKEALLDIRVADKQVRIASKVNKWIDGCADKKFNAVEPDNYDSYSRSKGLIDPEQALAFIALLATHAHDRGLAIGQKNASELAERRTEVKLDFAVAEQCGTAPKTEDECGDYARAFDDHVIDIEYKEDGPDGFARACKEYGDRLSIVQRDVDVNVPGHANYVRKTCADLPN